MYTLIWLLVTKIAIIVCIYMSFDELVILIHVYCKLIFYHSDNAVITTASSFLSVILFVPSVLTFVLGAQTDQLIETVLLSKYPQHMFWLRNKTIIF